MNSWHVSQFRYALGIGGLMSFYGIAAFLTYTVGPKLGLQLSQQIVVLILLLLTFPIALIIGYVATRKSKSEEEAAKAPDQAATAGTADTSVAGGPSATAPKSVSAASVQELSGGVEEVVNFLKTSNLGGANAKDAVYALPWYIVAGTPNSGKSSLVIGSRLNFQTLPSQRQSEQKIVRPTRGVEWRVTSDAVFVDTAGGYQNEGGAGEGDWSALLESIKKYRGLRPLDGMILVVDTETILGADERQIEERAKVMRARLDDAMQRLKVRFPVYLVFSHADAIEGFRDSFSTSKKEGETLVWGATIPLEKSSEAHQMFDEEYELLQTSVMKRRLMRLSAPFAPVRQLRIFNFPLHFGSARRQLGSFVSALFRPNPFSENPFLRGYYFISTPPARMPLPGQGEGSVPATVGQTYFTEKLVRDVILRDKDLVATFQQQRQKPPILSWLITLLGALTVFVLLVLAGVSVVNNRKLLKTAEDRGGAMLVIAREDGNVNPLSKPPDAATREVNAIEDLRVLLSDLDTYDRGRPPIYLGMGLYAGDAIYKGSDKTKGLLNIYYNAVDRRYMAPTVKKLEEELRKFAATAPVQNQNNMTPQEEDALSRGYDMLKVYLMLSDKYKTRSNADDIFTVLKEFWFTESKLPAALKDDAENQLRFYAKQSDRVEGPDKFPRIQTDNNLVTEVRKRLMVLPPYKRYYKEKVTEISKEIEGRVGEFTVNGMLLRAGGATDYLESKVAVPGAYTIEGFKAMDKAILTADLTKINWVVSDDVKPQSDPSALIQQEDAQKIREQYFRDYDDRWRDFVKNIRVRSYRKENEKDPNRLSAKDALQTFSSESSPMKLLLIEIVRNTDLSAKPVPKGWWETIKSWFKPDTLPDTGGTTPVERDFGPIFDFVKSKDATKNAKIDDYKASIEKVSNKYSAFSDTDINQLALKSDDEKNEQFRELKGETANVEKLIKPLRDAKESPVAPVIADLLAQPLGNLQSLLSADSIKRLGDKWISEILPVAQLAEAGYPFEGGDTNADFQKLKDYLAPSSGKLSLFYDQNLKKYFDGNPGSLKLRDPNNTPLSPEFVDYLNKALTLRQALFGKGDDMKFEYNFEITNPGDAIVEITIDGVTLSSAEKPSSPVSFPATTGGGNGVLIKLPSGPAPLPATSAPPASANPAAPAVNSNSAPKPAPAKSPSGGGSSDEKSFLGPWGLFRFFDACGPQKQSDNSYQLTYKLKSGKTLSAKVTPSGVDPFNKEIYRLRAPKTILK